MSVTQRDDHTFEVDLALLGRGGFWRRLLRTPVRVDPYLVSKAVFAVMDQCEIRDARGRPLMWNDYRIFLAEADHQVLAPLVSGLERDLAAMLQERSNQGQASLVGALNVDLLVSEGERLASGRVVIQASFIPHPTHDEGGPPGAVTVRADRRPASFKPSAPAGLARPPTANPDSAAVRTRRVADPGSILGAVRIQWGTHEEIVSIGVRVLLGRPHQSAPGAFIPLHGAGGEINRRHLFVEAQPDGGVIISRLALANAVHVNGHLVQPGGQLAIPDLPCEISLTNGKLQLTLEGVPPDDAPTFSDPPVPPPLPPGLDFPPPLEDDPEKTSPGIDQDDVP